MVNLTQWNGGGANSSGTGISNIDTQGNVHPDQFWHELNLGNVKERKFSDIWSNRDNPTLSALRDRKKASAASVASLMSAVAASVYALCK